MVQLKTGSNNGFAAVTQNPTEYHYEHTRTDNLRPFFRI